MVTNMSFQKEVSRFFVDEMQRAQIHIDSAKMDQEDTEKVLAHLKRARKHLKIAMTIIKFMEG